MIRFTGKRTKQSTNSMAKCNKRNGGEERVSRKRGLLAGRKERKEQTVAKAEEEDANPPEIKELGEATSPPVHQ
jgi:hypothetical protein